jgi:hypothetical protein
MKFHLLPEESIGKWDLWDMEWSHIINLPDIKENDWRKIRHMGARLQARSVLGNIRDVNPWAIDLWMRKAKNILSSWGSRFR